jgi:ApbE superfamily uncharacterized protein (UPF0280 family)
MMAASARLLPDGRRLHLQHGPIDIVAEATGSPGPVAAAYRRAARHFPAILPRLTAELPLLRTALCASAPPSAADPAVPASPEGRRMRAAALPHLPAFVTPMVAVAGAVAESVLSHLIAAGDIDRAYANNGGDIALHLAPGAAPFRTLIAVTPAAPKAPGTITIAPDDRVRGIASSGRHGRSHSLGIADGVTVLAETAAAADAAATMIANAVDLPGHPAIRRGPASAEAPDSDLGDTAVTLAVGPLAPAERRTALAAGASLADRLMAAGTIIGAVLVLGDAVTIVGPVPFSPAYPSAPGLRHAA